MCECTCARNACAVSALVSVLMQCNACTVPVTDVVVPVPAMLHMCLCLQNWQKHINDCFHACFGCLSFVRAHAGVLL